MAIRLSHDYFLILMEPVTFRPRLTVGFDF